MAETTYVMSQDTLLDSLLDDAGEKMIRANAFRVLGLSVEATDRDVKRQTEKLKMMSRFGDQSSGVGPMPLNSPPDDHVIGDAMQRLRDPERRLTDEFFWFWAEGGGRGAPDQALEALARGDRDSAVGTWEGRAEAGGDAVAVARHNLGVYHLTVALDVQCAAPPEGCSDELARIQESHWRSGLWMLYGAASDAQVGAHLTRRVRETDDPRLTEETARRLLATVPLGMLMINARLAVRAAEQGHSREANRQLRIMYSSGIGEELVAEALRRAAQPLRARVARACEVADKQSDAEAETGAAVARSLLGDTKPVLLALQALQPKGGPLIDEARDQVATTAVGCVIAYGNKTSDWGGAGELLELSRTFAASPSVRQRIADNLATIKGNLEALDYSKCWFCRENEGQDGAQIGVRMYGNVTRTPTYNGTRIHWQNLTVPVPRCARCVDVHKRMDSFWFRGLGLGFLGGVVVAGLMLLLSSWMGAWVGCETVIALVFILGAASWVGTDVGKQLSKISSPPGVQPSEHKTRFVGVEQMRQKGWVVGNQPT